MMSGVTLNELLREVGVTSAQLDETCTNEHLLSIAVFLESWKEVAPYLGLSNDDVVATEGNSHSEQEKKQKILRIWSAKFAFKAKYRTLIEGLLKIGRADQAQKLCCLLVPQQTNEGVFFKSYLMFLASCASIIKYVSSTHHTASSHPRFLFE